MEANSKIGINTTSEKNIEELKRRINSTRVDVDFFSTPMAFTSVEPQSANHLFGNGKWKKTIVDYFGEDTFQKYAERYGNKPIDFKITKLITPHAKHFHKNEMIAIKDKKGTYSGETKILDIGNCAIIVMIPFTCDASGEIINLNRKKGSENALLRLNQMLDDMQPSKITAAIPESKKETTTEQTTVSTAIEPIIESPKANYKPLKVLGITLIVIALLAITYKIIKNQNKQ